MTFEEPDRIYKKFGESITMSAIIGKVVVMFWFDDPSDYRTINVKDFDRKLKREEWECLN